MFFHQVLQDGCRIWIQKFTKLKGGPGLSAAHVHNYNVWEGSKGLNKDLKHDASWKTIH
jgi:hypothetical protein